MNIDSAVYVCSGGSDAGVVDLKPVREWMVESEWVSSSPINKGSYHLRVEGFSDIHISDFNGYFWVEGNRGFFKICEMKSKEFDDYFRLAISKMHNQKN